jgi:RimJ/RimL family protein N-acetyltransferase
VTLRPAGAGDSLAASDAVAPFVSWTAAQDLAPALEDPAQDLLVVEADGAFAGGARLVVRNRRSRISEVRSLMVTPTARGRGLGVATLRVLADLAFGERGVHRLEGEVLGSNVAAARTFEAAGFVREGVRRRAYDRGGTWQDGLLYGLLAEERPGG